MTKLYFAEKHFDKFNFRTVLNNVNIDKMQIVSQPNRDILHYSMVLECLCLLSLFLNKETSTESKDGLAVTAEAVLVAINRLNSGNYF